MQHMGYAVSFPVWDRVHETSQHCGRKQCTSLALNMQCYHKVKSQLQWITNYDITNFPIEGVSQKKTPKTY